MKLQESACTCHVCVGMCERRPCWGTPKELKAIIDVGLGHRLMRDYWAPDDKLPNVDILSPAIVGREGKAAPFWRNGRCTFLTSDGLCELHHKGLKPLEGRIATHDFMVLKGKPIHFAIAKSWHKPLGKVIVKQWEAL